MNAHSNFFALLCRPTQWARRPSFILLVGALVACVAHANGAKVQQKPSQGHKAAAQHSSPKLMPYSRRDCQTQAGTASFCFVLHKGDDISESLAYFVGEHALSLSWKAPTYRAQMKVVYHGESVAEILQQVLRDLNGVVGKTIRATMYKNGIVVVRSET